MRQLLCALGASLFAVTAVQAQDIPVNALSYSRTSSFEYYGPADGAKNGLIKAEVVEPDKPQLCVRTTYVYDAYGNKTGATTANCAGAVEPALFLARTLSSSYTPLPGGAAITVGAGTGGSVTTVQVLQAAGALQSSLTNALQHTETRRYDPRFGIVTSLQDPNGLQASTVLDDFGRVIETLSVNGTRTRTWYCAIGAGLATSSNTVHATKGGCPTGLGAEVPATAAALVQTISYDTADAAMSAPVRTYTDRLGREIRVATLSFDGTGQPGAARGAVIVTDTLYNEHGAKQVTTQPYFLASRSSTTAGSSDLGAAKTEYDAIGRPTITYVADPSGSIASVDFGVTVTRASRQRIVYDGLTTETFNDKEQRRVETRSVAGQVVLIQDAAGAQLAHKHDAFGNLIETLDALQNRIQTTVDVRGRTVQVIDPDAGLVKFAHDALGQVRQQQNAKHRALGANVMVALTYDVGGRLRQRVEPEYNTTWYYDTYSDNASCGKGRLCETYTSLGQRRRITYDALGRIAAGNTSFLNGGPAMASGASFHPVTGRLATQTYPSGLQVGYGYTATGTLEKLTLLTAATIQPLPAQVGGTAAPSASIPSGTVLWQAQSVNAWGSVELQSLATGVNNRAVFQAATGRISVLTAGAGLSNTVQNQSYTWDSLGQLVARADQIGDGQTGAVTESFTHGDALNRLTGYTVSAQNIAGGARSVTLQYNALGMLLFKSDTGVFSYAAQGGARPHALQWVGTTSGRVNYLHDENGNVRAADGGKYRTISHNTFNLPDNTQGVQGPNGQPKYTWHYDEAHARVYEERVTAEGLRKTWFLHPDNRGGLGFEREEAPGNRTTLRHYLSVGGQTIGVLASTANAAAGQITLVKAEFWHKDHLGSIVATTDHMGTVTARYAYDPFGKRRYSNGQYDEFGTLVVDWAPTVNAGTDRGFTGHEHLDDIGIIHMNGRLLDSHTGMFLEADPYVQSPGNLQSYHRYGYCMNNPTGCTDPSGFISISFTNPFQNYQTFLIDVPKKMRDQTVRDVFGFIRRQPGQEAIDRYVMTHEWAYMVGYAVATYYGGSAGAALYSSYYTYQSTGSIRAAQRAAAIAIATSVANYWVGSTFTSGYSNVAAHAVLGCVSSEASGGDCKSGAAAGALSAGIAEAGLSTGSKAGNFVLHIVIGGTVSVVGGDKFSNGAMQAAFSYLFNCEAHKCSSADYDRDDPNTHFSPPQSTGTICNLSTDGCLAAVQTTLGCKSAPGQSGCTAVGQQAQYDLTGITSKNPITQYRYSENLLINGTSRGHIFHDGYVVRWIAIDSIGNVSIWSAGYGRNSWFGTKWGNQIGGPMLFNDIGIQNKIQVQCQLKMRSFGC